MPHVAEWPGSRPDVPMPVLGLAQWFRRCAERNAERPAVTFEDVCLSYADMQQQIEAAAARLAACGVGPGVRVGYLGLNHPRFLVAMFATARLGGIFVPLNYRLTGPELAFVIDDAGVHALLCDSNHTAVIDGVRAQLACEAFLSVSGPQPGWADLQEGTSAPVPAEYDAAPDDVALIMYTSGTTGRPKGAMLTHGNFWTTNINAVFSVGLGTSDVALNFAPLFHVGGLCSCSVPALMAGAHLVLQKGWDPAQAMQAVERYKVTCSFAVPAMLLFMSQHPDFPDADLSSLRNISVGGAPMPEPLLHLYEQRGVPVNQGYGLTETTASATFLDPRFARRKLGSCGTAPLLSEVCVMGSDDQIITQPHSKGEVCVRGGNVTKGYWNRPDATAAAFTADGWFRTGDVGYIDEDGFFYICDRVKDMVISGGENVYPAEVESVLYEHPAIAEVAVIGAQDDTWGERVVAVVVLRPDAVLTLVELQEFAAARLARYKLPREIRFIDALPRNPTGKVLKHLLREAVHT